VSDPESYLEQCIAALPPQKREAARKAFREISEIGDDSYLNKLLAVLEANNAYAKQIPKELADAGTKLLQDVAEIADRLTQQRAVEDGRREAGLKKLLTEQFSGFEEALALDKIAAGMESQRSILEQLKRPAPQEVGTKWVGVLFLIAVAFFAGIALTAFIIDEPFKEALKAKRFMDQVADAGISIRLDPSKTGNWLTVAGPEVKEPHLYASSDGSIAGAVVEFGKPK